MVAEHQGVRTTPLPLRRPPEDRAAGRIEEAHALAARATELLGRIDALCTPPPVPTQSRR